MAVFFAWLQAVYQNNKGLWDTLIGVLATTLIGVIAFVARKILAGWHERFGSVPNRIRIRLQGRTFLRAYLRWIVINYQDVHIPGLMTRSVGQPKLDEIFADITLRDLAPTGTILNDGGLKSLLRRINVIRRLMEAAEAQARLPASIVFFNKRSPSRVGRLTHRFGKLLESGCILATVAIAILMFAIPAYVALLGQPGNWLVASFAVFAVTLLSILLLAQSVINANPGLPGLVLSELTVIAVVTIYDLLVAYGRGFNPHTLISITVLAHVPTGLFLYGLWRTENAQKLKNALARQLQEAFAKNSQLAILGQPGSGKSTLLQYIALTLALDKTPDRKLRRKHGTFRKLGLDRWRLPIIIPLRMLPRVRVDPHNDSYSPLLMDAWQRYVLPSSIRAELPSEFILELLNNKQCVFLLDGLDEVPSDDDFKMAVKEIQGLCSRYPGNLVVVTSRSSGWRGGVGSSFSLYEIGLLDSNAINRYVWRWTKMAARELTSQMATSKSPRQLTDDDVSQQAKRLIRTVEQNVSLRTLASNPLFLSLICYVHNYRPLPENRAALYQECSNLLLADSTQTKSEVRGGVDFPLGFIDDCLLTIAFRLHVGSTPNGMGRKELTGQELQAIITDRLVERALPNSMADETVAFLVSKTGIIVRLEAYEDKYAFIHLTFQEFFAARYIVRRQISLSVLLSQINTEELATWWREVIQLAALMGANLEELSQSLISKSAFDLDDLAGQRVRLLAQCIDQADAASDPKVEPRLLERLLSIWAGVDLRVNAGKTDLAPLKHYLVHFVNSSQFYTYALRRTFEQCSESDRHTATTKLVDLVDSSEADISLAAIKELHVFELEGFMSEALAERVVQASTKHQSAEVMIETISLFAGKHTEINDSSATDIAHLLSSLFGAEADVSKEMSKNVLAYKKDRATLGVIEVLGHARYQSQIAMQIVQQALWQAYWVTARRRVNVGYLGIPDSFQPKLAATIIWLSPIDQRELFIGQFESMLEFGSYGEQELAVRTLTALSHALPVSGLAAKLLALLGSPSREVRHTALEHLPLAVNNNIERAQLASDLTALGATQHTAFAWVGQISELFTGWHVFGTAEDDAMLLNTAIRELQDSEDHVHLGTAQLMSSLAETDAQDPTAILALVDEFDKGYQDDLPDVAITFSVLMSMIDTVNSVTDPTNHAGIRAAVLALINRLASRSVDSETRLALSRARLELGALDSEELMGMELELGNWLLGDDYGAAQIAFPLFVSLLLEKGALNFDKAPIHNS